MQPHPQKKRRLACDRCNALKLRCPKVAGSQSCARCTKISAVCVFSPSMRGFRPSGIAAQGQTHPHLAGGMDWNVDVHVDPGSVGFMSNDYAVGFEGGQSNRVDLGAVSSVDADIFNSLGSIVPPRDELDGTVADLNAWMRNGNVDFNAHWQPDTPVVAPWQDTNGQNSNPASKYPSTSKSIPTRLADLVLRLEDISSLVPPLSIHDTPESYATALSAAKQDLRNGALIPLVQIFEATQTLVDIYTSIIDSELCASTEQKENDHTHTCLLFLLVATHHRTLDMWAETWGHFETCHSKGKFNAKAIAENNSTTPCQRLRIGGFVPRALSVPMEMVLAAEFLGALRDSVGRIEGMELGIGVKEAVAALGERARGMVGRVEAVRGVIQRELSEKE